MSELLAAAAARWETALGDQVVIDPDLDPIAAADATTSLDDTRIAFVQAALALRQPTPEEER